MFTYFNISFHTMDRTLSTLTVILKSNFLLICTYLILMQFGIWIGCDADAQKHFNSENASICNFLRKAQPNNKRSQRGSNSRPSACEADLITTTPWNRLFRLRRLCHKLINKSCLTFQFLPDICIGVCKQIFMTR